MLPNFLGLGAQKSGTTSLVHYLRSHPDIYLPAPKISNRKEINFFFHDNLYKKGTAYYESFFKHHAGKKAVGEVSPDYLYHPVCLKRIKRDLGHLKFIIILRNPIDRAYSNYWMEVRRGNEALSFENAIQREAGRIQRGVFEKDTYGYVQRGYYHTQINAYMQAFPESEFLLLLSEDLKLKRAKTLKQVFRFLQVDADVQIPNMGTEYHTATRMRSVRLHQYITTQKPHWTRRMIKLFIPFPGLRNQLRTYLIMRNEKPFFPSRMKPETRKKLAQVYQESIDKLSVLMNADLTHWR